MFSSHKVHEHPNTCTHPTMVFWAVNYHAFSIPRLTDEVRSKYNSRSSEIRRRLLLGRKAMTNPDSVLKGRDITLQTKVHIVKAMVFPVVAYGCESWTIKKAECQRIGFEMWC